MVQSIKATKKENQLPTPNLGRSWFFFCFFSFLLKKKRREGFSLVLSFSRKKKVR